MKKNKYDDKKMWSQDINDVETNLYGKDMDAGDIVNRCLSGLRIY